MKMSSRTWGCVYFLLWAPSVNWNLFSVPFLFYTPSIKKNVLVITCTFCTSKTVSAHWWWSRGKQGNIWSQSMTNSTDSVEGENPVHPIIYRKFSETMRKRTRNTSDNRELSRETWQHVAFNIWTLTADNYGALYWRCFSFYVRYTCTYFHVHMLIEND